MLQDEQERLEKDRRADHGADEQRIDWKKTREARAPVFVIGEAGKETFCEIFQNRNSWKIFRLFSWWKSEAMFSVQAVW